MPKTNLITNPIFQPKPTDPRFKDIEGQVFNRLTVIGYAGKNIRTQWFCKCICGNITIVKSNNLLTHTAKSCGCWHKEQAGKVQRTHGEANKTSEYRAYKGARTRCNNANNQDYLLYGGRGVEFRFTSYEEFLNEVGRKPSAKHSLDRINSNGHYEKGNVRWATDTEQARNKRNNILITLNNITKNIRDWAESFGIKPSVAVDRYRRGWCGLCSVTLHPQHYNKRNKRCNHITK